MPANSKHPSSMIAATHQQHISNIYYSETIIIKWGTNNEQKNSLSSKKNQKNFQINEQYNEMITFIST